MYVNCSKAFRSPEEAHEWQYIVISLENAESFPISIRIAYQENVIRLKRHGYSITAHPHNMYELTKKSV